MRALVTGGLGFIGSNLTKLLLDKGFSVDIVDDMSAGDLDSIYGINFRTIPVNFLLKYQDEKESSDDKDLLVITGDFSHRHILDRIANNKYQLVFHLAAIPRVSYSVENPIETSDINIMRTIKLLTACVGNIKRFIFSSSSAVYGDVDQNFPSRERGLENPNSPYALQKKVVEDYCSLYSKLYNLETVSLRYFNVFGPGQLGDNSYATAVSSWVNCISNKKPLRSDGDGTQSRDLVFVTDVCQANLLAATASKKMFGQIYNVGTGKSYSNNQVLQMLEDKCGRYQIINAPIRPGDVKHTQADISKIQKDLGFKPIIEFEDGLEKTLKWWDII